MKIRSPETPEDWQRYYHLRWQVLREPWGMPEGSERDETEQEAVHFAAWEAGQPIAVVRLHEVEPGKGQVRFMAVASSMRGKGVGRVLMNALEADARYRGLKHLFLNAREGAVDFYLRLGWRVIEPVKMSYTEVPHWRMAKDLC